VIAAGNSTNFTTFEGASYIFHSIGAHTTWTTQQLGSGDFADDNFAFFANNLWLVGNDKTQLFTAADTAGGTVALDHARSTISSTAPRRAVRHRRRQRHLLCHRRRHRSHLPVALQWHRYHGRHVRQLHPHRSLRRQRR